MLKNRKHFSSNFERDYNFYLSNKDNFIFSGLETDTFIKSFNLKSDENGSNAKNCFFYLDSNGRCNPCSQLDLLVQLLNCKAAVNLQIKIWAQSRAEFSICESELMEYIDFYQAPDWVLKAVENQKISILQNQFERKLEFNSSYYMKGYCLHFGEALRKISSKDGEENDKR